MLCQDCNKNEATVHLTQIVNNQKTMLNLCKQWISARGFHSPLENVPFPLAEILSGFASSPQGAPPVDTGDPLTCPGCGLTFQAFTRQGRFGCGECYKAFRSRLEPIMRKIHGASLHRGQRPVTVIDGAADDDAIPVKEEERLEAELAKAIESEDFERAAEIRDKLKTIREESSLHR